MSVKIELPADKAHKQKKEVGETTDKIPASKREDSAKEKKTETVKKKDDTSNLNIKPEYVFLFFFSHFHGYIMHFILDIHQGCFQLKKKSSKTAKILTVGLVTEI